MGERAAKGTHVEHPCNRPFEAQISLANAHIRKRPAQRSDIGRDGHAVVVQYDDERHLRRPRVVERLKRHAARKRAIADERDGGSLLAAKLHGARHTERGGNGGACVAGVKCVMRAFRTLRETADTTFGAQGVKAGIAPGEQLMRICLVPDVKHELILWR